MPSLRQMSCSPHACRCSLVVTCACDVAQIPQMSCVLWSKPCRSFLASCISFHRASLSGSLHHLSSYVCGNCCPFRAFGLVTAFKKQGAVAQESEKTSTNVFVRTVRCIVASTCWLILLPSQVPHPVTHCCAASSDACRGSFDSHRAAGTHSAWHGSS